MPELERLLLAPLADAQPRNPWAGIGLLTVGVAAGVGGVSASTLNFGWHSVVLCIGLSAVRASVGHMRSTDWATRRFAYAAKRGGEPWYLDTMTPRPTPFMPRGAATLQAIAAGTIDGLGGAASVTVFFMLWQPIRAMSTLSATFGQAVTASLQIPLLGGLAAGVVDRRRRRGALGWRDASLDDVA